MALTQRTLREVFASGSMPTLLYAHHQGTAGGRQTRPMHSHQAICELLICYHGAGIYNLNNQSYPIRPGDLIYYNAGDSHEVVSETDSEVGTYCLGYSNVHLRGLSVNQLLPEDSSFVRPAGQKESMLLALAEEIIAAAGTDPVSEVSTQLMGTVFLLTACSVPAPAMPVHIRSGGASSIAQPAKDFIDLHYTETISLEQLAQLCACSTSRLAHMFKELTGYAPQQYIIRSRIGYAETLLISSDYSVTHISSLAGFESPSYFHRAFRKLVGVTPQQYRKNYLAELRGERKQI